MFNLTKPHCFFFLKTSLVFLLFLFSYCKSVSSSNPKAVQGKLDLTHLNSNEHSLYMDGEWEFFPEEFVPVNDNNRFQSKREFLSVPGNWNQFFSSGKGYGTYRLKVQLPPHWDFPIAVKLFEQGTAYKLFINGKEMAHNGKVGSNKEEATPQALPLVTDSFANTGVLEIVFHISNFHFREGGLWYPILLGKTEILQKERESNLNLDMFLLGSILIMGIYHTVLYFIRKKDTSPLWFSFFCFDIIFRLLSFNEKYIHTLFPNISYLWSTRIEYWAYYLAVPLFAQFLYSIFPEIFPKKIAKLIWTITTIFVLFVLFTDSGIFTHSAPYFHICTLGSASFFLFVIGKAMIQRRESSFMLFLGTSTLIGGTVNDILYSMEYIHTFYIVPQALLFFIFIQSVLLSMRFSRAFMENEKLALNLSELNESLEKKVQERTIEYKSAKEKVEQVSKVKDKFVAIVSHDLRTPMVGVSNLLEILKGKNYVQTDEERDHLINICFNSVQHSLAMIKQLLNFSRIETGTLKLKYEKVDFQEFINSILTDSIAMMKSKNIQLELDITPPGILWIDPEVFSHVLNNLISNSIKFTGQGGRIVIRSSQDHEFFKIEVEDNGIGIPSEKLQNLFDPEKVKSTLGTKGEMGNGMGLFICKYIIEAHQGQIQFESAEGKGFLCRIFLPIE